MKEMLTKMTVKELRAYAKDNNLQIAKMYELKKDELIEAIVNAEIVKKEEKCIDAEFDGFSPDMFAEAVELENSRTDYGTKEIEKEIAEYESKTDLWEEVTEAENSKRNGWEKIAIDQLTGAYNMFIGGLENTLQDYAVDDEEYQNAYATLCSEPEDLINEIYSNACNCKYGPGYEGGWGTAPKEMKFAGTEFCKGFLNDLLKKDGFCGYSPAYPISSGTTLENEEELEEDLDIEVTPTIKVAPKKIYGKYGKAKYQCPNCDNVMTNEDPYCGKCGTHLYHGNDKIYDAEESLKDKGVTIPHVVDALLITKYGKTHKYCPCCNARVDWDESFRFCIACGQEVK